MFKINYRIAAYVKWKGISKARIISELKCASNTVYEMLKGKHVLDIDRYMKICDVLCLPYAYFLDGSWLEIPDVIFDVIGVNYADYM